jgi:hypothetical protein
MRIGIVGSEAAKFTPETEAKARIIIRDLIDQALKADGQIPVVVSGECHLGGVDIYAKDEALSANVGYIGHPPKKLQWEGGYKQRNLLIAKDSDVVYCLTLRRLPASYSGMTFGGCYHCHTTNHVKSGGCWTVKVAKEQGKRGEIIVIDED